MDDGMVQLKVGMTVPNLKITTRAADEGEKLTSIKGLCYDENGTLTKIADATDISTTTFNMRVPTETRIIHFLANLPGDCSLPELTTTEDALKNLTTKSSSMTYWGRTTFNATPADCNITFYRNKARIIIKAADGSSVSMVGIAGVVNAYDTGMLVPYDGAYNFDLSTDYPTVPTEDFTKGNVMVNTNPLPTQYDVFEHPNTGTSQASSLYAICLIGSKYYKVALGTPDEDGMVTDNYFRIIRNHKYVISVADVDDVDSSLGADWAEGAVNLAPINDPNIKVEDVVDVVVTLSTSTETLDYNTTSISNLMLSVTVPPEVDKLTLSTPGFTVTTFSDKNLPDTETKYLVDNGNGSFTVNHPENDEEHTFSFRLKLNDNPQQSSYDLSCTATSNDENVQITQPTPVTVLLKKVDDDTNVYWQGNVALDYHDSASKIPIPAAKLTKGATVTFEYVKGEGNAEIGLQHADWDGFNNNPTLDLSQDATSFTITEDLYNEIQDNKAWVYEVADAGMVVQGRDITLTKITIVPVQVENVSLTVNPTTASLYYDSNNTQQITVTVPDGKTLSQLTITPSVDCFTITPATGELTGLANGVYTYAPDGGVTGTVVFTIAPKSGYNFTNVSSSTLTFGGTGVDMNVSTAQTAVTLTAMPVITANADKTTLYYDTDNQTITVNVKIPKGVSALGITATDFTVTQYDNNVGSYSNGIYTLNNANSEQNVQFVFTMNNVSSTLGKTSTTIEFSDNAGVATSPSPITISLTEKPEQGDEIVFYLNEDESVTLLFNKPEGATDLKVEISNGNPLNLSAPSHGYTWASEHAYYYENQSLPSASAEMNFTFTIKESFLETSGDYLVTIARRNGTEPLATTNIQVIAEYDDVNIIWEDEDGREMSANNTFISSGTLLKYAGQKLRFVVESLGDNAEFVINDSFTFRTFEEVEYTISENPNENLRIRGSNVVLKKVYIIQ